MSYIIHMVDFLLPFVISANVTGRRIISKAGKLKYFKYTVKLLLLQSSSQY